MDDRIAHHFQSCDEIWHAGDIGSFVVTDALQKLAPLRAVHGNIDDHRLRAHFPEMLSWKSGGMEILMIHIGGRPGRYAKGIRALLKEKSPDLFICGHSHLLRVERDASWEGLYINPGAAGKQGFHVVRTLIRMTIGSGQVQNMEVIELEGIR